MRNRCKAAALLLVFLLGMQSLPVRAETLTDSGIDYQETAVTVNNPGAGYTSTVWYVCKPGDTPVKNPTGNLVVLFIDIGAFSSGVNGGTDLDLDESFFAGIRGTLENCRNNGCTVGLRFRYDANGTANPEPATFEKMLDHIAQIDADGFLRDYEDILMYVESGFVGAWGEQHSGKYTSLEDKARLLDALLKIVPESVPVTVRTPNTICAWADLPHESLKEYVTTPGTDAARIGLYNDGYMGSDTDLGTFISPNRADSVAFMREQMTHTYYGGEFSGNIEFAQQYDNYLPENAIPEMYETHLSYINSNIWGLYRDETYTRALDTQPCDNSAYYGESVYQFMRDHLGYRFVLRDSRLTASAKQGGEVTVQFSVENTGFANPVKAQHAEVILEQDGRYLLCDTDIDDRTWLSTKTATETLHLTLPSGIAPGDWHIFLKLTAGNTDPESPQRTVKFANADVYNSSLGANYLGTVQVTADPDAAPARLCEEGNAPSDGVIYDDNGKITVDGAMGEREWQDDALLMQNEQSTVWMAQDGEFLYLCAKVPDTADAPVYNLQWKTPDAEKQSWMYHASNGFVYYSGEDTGGVVCKFSGGVVEWKIPMTDAMAMHPGDTLESLRLFVQDSANDWKLIEDMRTADIALAAPVEGDVNADGSFDVLDAVHLQKWVLCEPGVHLRDAGAGDLCRDSVLDVFDLALMKRALTTP